MACQGGPFVLSSPTCRGAVAQLGERLHGMQEVVSSNLISSTAQSWLLMIHFNVTHINGYSLLKYPVKGSLGNLGAPEIP